MDYKHKYLKYKTKYLEYKEILGSSRISSYRRQLMTTGTTLDRKRKIKRVIDAILSEWRDKFGASSIVRSPNPEHIFLTCTGRPNSSYHVHLFVDENGNVVYSPKNGNVVYSPKNGYINDDEHKRPRYIIKLGMPTSDIVRLMIEDAGYVNNQFCKPLYTQRK